ncbi:hypothetical protein L6R50_02685 [Myxococcota bacterium]|nr:hypothetical protein [Myxococcota bacterium]
MGKDVGSPAATATGLRPDRAGPGEVLQGNWEIWEHNSSGSPTLRGLLLGWRDTGSTPWQLEEWLVTVNASATEGRPPRALAVEMGSSHPNYFKLVTWTPQGSGVPSQVSAGTSAARKAQAEEIADDWESYQTGQGEIPSGATLVRTWFKPCDFENF